MTFREWRYSDILRISELEKECFPREAWSYQMLATCFTSPSFYGILCEDGGEIIGYGGITVAADSADIENIAVAEAYRRCGAGGEMLARLAERAWKSGAADVYLEVRVSNTPALMMYLKNGFNGVYARTRYYPDGEDCLVMKKSVK